MHSIKATMAATNGHLFIPDLKNHHQEVIL